MPTFQERNGRIRAIVRRARRKAQTRTFGTRKEAERWARGVERRLTAGKQTLAEAIDTYISDPDRELSKYHRKVLDWWRTELGARHLAQLRRGDFVEARDKLRRMLGRRGERLAPATVNWRMAAISAVLTAALEREWIPANPARMERLPEKNGRERLLDADERARLLEACQASDEPCLYPLVVTAMLTGARAGELRRLIWRDVDLDDGRARLWKTKNGGRRSVPVRGRALDLLKALGEGKSPDAPVFVDRHGRGPFEYAESWTRARALARVTDVRFHDLRHLAASELAMAGATLRELQEVLGHSSAAMTKRYTHFIETHFAGLGDRLNDRLFGEPGAPIPATPEERARSRA